MQSVTQKSEKVQLLAGVPVTMVLQHSTPQTGTGKFGEWLRFTVMVDGVTMSFFPSRMLADALTAHGAQRGSALTVTKAETLVNGQKRAGYRCELDGVSFSVGNGNGKPQPQRSREDVQRDVDALYGDDRDHAVSHGYGLTKDDLAEPQPSARMVYVELSTGVFKFTLQEFSELVDWAMVNSAVA